MSEIQIAEGVETIYAEEFKNDLKFKELGNRGFCSTFHHENTLTKVSMPETVKRIAAKSFEHCHKLSCVNLNYGIEEIGMSAFLGCEELNALNMPDTVKYLGEWSFGLIKHLIIDFFGTREQFDKIEKAPNWTGKETIIKFLDDGTYLVWGERNKK